MLFKSHIKEFEISEFNIIHIIIIQRISYVKLKERIEGENKCKISCSRNPQTNLQRGINNYNTSMKKTKIKVLYFKRVELKECFM